MKLADLDKVKGIERKLHDLSRTLEATKHPGCSVYLAKGGNYDPDVKMDTTIRGMIERVVLEEIGQLHSELKALGVECEA